MTQIIHLHDWKARRQPAASGDWRACQVRRIDDRMLELAIGPDRYELTHRGAVCLAHELLSVLGLSEEDIR
jgi:hypothetical protein